MPELLVGATLAVIVMWRTIAAWGAVDPADLKLPYGHRSWPFGAEYYCKALRSVAAGLCLALSIALYGLAEVTPGIASLAGHASTSLVGVAMLLFIATWSTGRPRMLVPPILRDYDCRSSGPRAKASRK